MATLSIAIEAICSGMGHWRVTVAIDGAAVADFPVDFDALQAGAEPREIEAAALALLKVACAGKAIQDVQPLLLSGVEVAL